MRKRQASSSAHRFPSDLRARGKPAGGTPDLRVQDQPGGKRNFGSSAATGKKALRRRLTGQDRVSTRELRNRRSQDFGPWPSGGTRGFGRGSRHQRIRSFGRGNCDGGKRDVSSEPPNGEPPGLRPWSGSPRGNRFRLRLEMDPGGSGAGTPGSGAATRNRPCGTPCLPGQVSATGQWGPAATPAPITVWGASPADPSCCRPASWQRA